MITYTDFLETKNTPFANGLEETVAYLGWLDLFLSAQHKILQNKAEPDWKQIQKELKAGAQILYERQLLSQGRPFDALNGISITQTAAQFQLQGYPFFCLLLAIAPAFDEKYIPMYQALRQDGAAHGNPTFALAESLYELIADEAELLAARRSMNTIAACPLFCVQENESSELLDHFSASRQLTALLKGDFIFEGFLRQFCNEITDAAELPPVLIGKEQYTLLRSLLETPAAENEHQLIHISGAKGAGKKFLTAHAAAQSVLFVNMETFLHQEPKEAMEAFREILVRTVCTNSLLVLSEASVEQEQLDLLKTILSLCFTIQDRVVLTTETTENMHILAGSYAYFHIALPPCKPSERRLLWEYYLYGCPIAEDVSLEAYAGTYSFTPGTIRRCIEQAALIAQSEALSCLTNQTLREAIRHFNSSRLAELAVRIEPHFNWEDIEIAPEQLSVMRLVCARAALRGKVDEEWGFSEKVAYGKGMSILLYGPPGTGKTMAAQIMAKEIGMDLYRVDLSQMVDKYIGETEKNIGKIFDCAKEGSFILFFDEADSMFSKRTEVQNSNDKHANTETAYLLQKIEEYDGITFLATNRYNNFDSAFLRRITYSVKLDKPDAKTRLRLFESILPASARVDEPLDFRFFAEQFELTGSNIKAILYNAAFMAAAENRGICNEHIARAVKYELEKLGKMVLAAEMGMYGIYL